MYFYETIRSIVQLTGLSLNIISSLPVKRSAISQDLLARAHELWGLLPSFCRHATDTYEKFACLSDLLITILKKNPSMHENISMALQVCIFFLTDSSMLFGRLFLIMLSLQMLLNFVQILVNENRTVLNPRNSEADCYAAEDSLLEFGILPAYSKKVAMRNVKALASCSNQLLQILSDSFINSFSDDRVPLKVVYLSLIKLL